MSKLAKFLIYFTIIMGVIGLFLSYGASRFPVLKSGSKVYFELIEKQRYSAAYQLMSKEFKQDYSYQDFLDLIRLSKLDQATNWTPLEEAMDEENMKGAITGKIFIRDVGWTILRVEFVREQLGMAELRWSINYVEVVEQNN